MANSINGIRGSSKADLNTASSAENEDVGLGWDNLRDVETLPKEIKHKITFIPVKNYLDAYRIISE